MQLSVGEGYSRTFILEVFFHFLDNFDVCAEKVSPCLRPIKSVVQNLLLSAQQNQSLFFV